MCQFDAALSRLGASWQGELPLFRHMTDDSREVCPGDLFVLRQGAQPLTQARAFEICAQAIEKGAAAIVASPDFLLPSGVCVIALPEPEAHLLALAQGFYGEPGAEMKIVAVTGTNGKTSTACIIESLAQSLGLRVGVMGTVSHRYPGYCEESINTTPGVLKLYRLLHGMASAGCDMVVMEVSSHAVVQGRIQGLHFDAAVWLNLGTDHLDYHKTREAYASAKARLFSEYLARSYVSGKRPVAVFNADDGDVSARMASCCAASWGGKVVSFSTHCGVGADLAFESVIWQGGRWCGVAKWEGESQAFTLPLMGRYNLDNAAAGCAALMGLGFSPSGVIDAMSEMRGIPGRMQAVSDSPCIMIDFAHTPEALERSLCTVRETMPSQGRLIVVFGAGGDRDPSKRPMMGEAASRGADYLIVTSDNPRTEDPETIVDAILTGVSGAVPCERIVDRREAIGRAVFLASDQDVVIVTGKGHEDYQIVGNERRPFDEPAIIGAFLSERKQN
ncbi:MAG: UDP-N-acetylmuramoyl-L-alanyl-D-glutamate--2,6-diaminopimelate ligase [Proteobacteria bacterium]|nr:UDP-N-acetylmuramoyl-L-alanyl-D-glutamate--2,6-diaminopimelate ligase [Pseudomonadota bacterium]